MKKVIALSAVLVMGALGMACGEAASNNAANKASNAMANAANAMANAANAAANSMANAANAMANTANAMATNAAKPAANAPAANAPITRTADSAITFFIMILLSSSKIRSNLFTEDRASTVLVP